MIKGSDEVSDDEVEEARSKEQVMKCVIVRDWDGKCVFAHAIPRKGRDEEQHTAALVASDVDWLGYSRVIIKSDNEPAAIALGKAVAAHLRVNGDGITASQEHPPRYDSQANGGTEIASNW